MCCLCTKAFTNNQMIYHNSWIFKLLEKQQKITCSSWNRLMARSGIHHLDDWQTKQLKEATNHNNVSAEILANQIAHWLPQHIYVWNTSGGRAAPKAPGMCVCYLSAQCKL